MKLVVPDLISPSYFPAIAAVESGCIAKHGVSVDLEVDFPVTTAIERLRSGEVDVVAGAAHTLFHGADFADDLQILGRLSRNTYWFLVVHAKLRLDRRLGLEQVRGLRIGAAPGPVDALVQMLIDGGVDPDDVEIGPIPPSEKSGLSFGVAAADALQHGQIDGFWANGMGAEIAVRKGIGTVLIDARRGDGPINTQYYTFAGIMARREAYVHQRKDYEAVIGGIMETQQRLRSDPLVSADVADRLFPPMEARILPSLIARDAPYYDPRIEPARLDDLLDFAMQRGYLRTRPPIETLVPPNVRELWTRIEL